MRSFSASKLPVIMSVFFSLFVIFYAVYQLDWRTARLTLSSLRWGWLLLAFLAYVLNYVLRALRFQILLSIENASFFQLLAATGLHGMYNYLLPAKSGEITLIVLLKQRLKISIVDGATSLLAARYFDFATIALILPFVLVMYLGKLPNWMVAASLLFCALVFLTSLLLYFFLLRDSAPSSFLARPRDGWAGKAIKMLIGLRDGMTRIYQRRVHIRLLALTLAIWMCVYTNFYLIVVSLGYQITYFQVVVISIIMIPMNLLPVQGFANLGAHEVGWAVAFSVFNQSQADALNVAFGSHIVLLFFVLTLGAGSYGLGLYLRARDGGAA